MDVIVSRCLVGTYDRRVCAAATEDGFAHSEQALDVVVVVAAIVVVVVVVVVVDVVVVVVSAVVQRLEGEHHRRRRMRNIIIDEGVVVVSAVVVAVLGFTGAAISHDSAFNTRHARHRVWRVACAMVVYQKI